VTLLASLVHAGYQLGAESRLISMSLKINGEGRKDFIKKFTCGSKVVWKTVDNGLVLPDLGYWKNVVMNAAGGDGAG
jgi:hypothetical protein